MKYSSFINGWRVGLSVSQTWEDDTHIEYEVTQYWESNGSSRISDKSASANIEIGEYRKTVGFNAENLAKKTTLYVTSERRKLEKRNTPYDVKIKGEVTINGQSSPRTALVTDTVRVPESRKGTLGKPSLESDAIYNGVSPDEAVRLKFSRAEEPGRYSFKEFVLVLLTNDGSERVLYRGKNTSLTFVPSKYAKFKVSLVLKEIHYGNEESCTDVETITIGQEHQRIYDRYPGPPYCIKDTLGQLRDDPYYVLADLYC